MNNMNDINNPELDIIIEENINISEEKEIDLYVPTKEEEQKDNKRLLHDEVDIEPLPTLYYIGIYSGMLLMFIGLIVATFLEYSNRDAWILITKKAIIYSTIMILLVFNGLAKQRYDIKVNYTRKVSHIVIWAGSFISDQIANIDESLLSTFWNVFFAALGLMLWTIPIRKYDPTGLMDIVYSGVDRPEDRPNSLKWLVWQNVGVGISVLPFAALWDYWKVEDFILIPLMIVTFGDGFAEPIGIKFGKHKYKVKGLCTDQEYTRSLEGSFMVFLSAIVVICSVYTEFEKAEFFANLIILPFIATLCEAVAPHSLDNPIIIIVTSTILSLIHFVARETNSGPLFHAN